MLMKSSEIKKESSELDVKDLDVESCLKSNVKKIPTKSVWYLGIGANNHMCGGDVFFDELTKVNISFMSFGDDSKWL